MTHAEVVIARQAVEEGRGLVVIVNKMDILQGEQYSKLFKKVMEAVPLEIQTVIPQVCLLLILTLFLIAVLLVYTYFFIKFFIV